MTPSSKRRSSTTTSNGSGGSSGTGSNRATALLVVSAGRQHRDSEPGRRRRLGLCFCSDFLYLVLHWQLNYYCASILLSRWIWNPKQKQKHRSIFDYSGTQLDGMMTGAFACCPGLLFLLWTPMNNNNPRTLEQQLPKKKSEREREMAAAPTVTTLWSERNNLLTALVTVSRQLGMIARWLNIDRCAKKMFKVRVRPLRYLPLPYRGNFIFFVLRTPHPGCWPGTGWQIIETKNNKKYGYTGYS